MTLGDGKGSDFDHVSALQAFMDKVEGASEEQKKSLLLSKKDMLVSLDRNGTRLAAYLPIKDAKTVEEQGHCPGKITGFEEPRSLKLIYLHCICFGSSQEFACIDFRISIVHR